MRKGKELILATKAFAHETPWLSWYYMLSTYFLLGLSLASIFYVEFWTFRLPLAILAGLLIVRLFVIYHDHQHHAILQRSRMADLFMKAFGLFVLAPSSIWKRSHDYHHAHNCKLFSASIGSYPIMTKEKFLQSDSSTQKLYLFSRHPLTILFGYLFMFIYGMCIQSFLKAPSKHIDSFVSLLLHALIGTGLYLHGGFELVFFFQTMPFLIACCMGSYLFYAQHNFPGVEFKDKDGWTYEHAALDSSSFMEMSSLMNWFTASIGYHHIHHMNSRIPFYRLKETMEKIPELQRVKKTSLKPTDIYSCFKLKIWDPEQNKMISIREI